MDMNTLEAEKLLNLAAGHYTINDVLQNFLTTTPDKDIMSAKNVLIRKLIEDMITTDGKFKIGPTPFKSPCTACSGTGELYRFFRQVVEVPCICNRGYIGKEKNIKCSRCRGTGRVKIVVLDATIKSTTRCHKCGGVGFIPEKVKKVRNLQIIF